MALVVKILWIVAGAAVLGAIAAATTDNNSGAALFALPGAFAAGIVAATVGWALGSFRESDNKSRPALATTLGLIGFGSACIALIILTHSLPPI